MGKMHAWINNELEAWIKLIKTDEIKNNMNLFSINVPNKIGINTRPIWKLISNLAPYSKFPKAPLPISSSLEKRILNIPSNIIISWKK